AASTPSWASSSVSIATASAVASKLGPVHLVGHAFLIVQLRWLCRLLSISVMVRFCRVMVPLITSLRHFHRSSSLVMPRWSEMFENEVRPGSSRCERSASLPSRYLVEVVLESSPEHCLNPATVSPFQVTVKLKPLNGSFLKPVVSLIAMSHAPFSSRHRVSCLYCWAATAEASPLTRRTTMNSPGRAGATPTSVTTCPASCPSGGLVSASHLT